MKCAAFAPVGLLVTLALGQAAAQEAREFRVIGIPAREHGYGNFKTQVIGSQKAFDAFVKQVEGQSGWNRRPAFLKALADAKLDFARESLVLVRQTEGSGSNRVTFATPTLKSNKLSATIERQVAGIGTADIADYCFAVAVARGKVKEVEVWVTAKGAARPKKPRDVLAIKPNTEPEKR